MAPATRDVELSVRPWAHIGEENSTGRSQGKSPTPGPSAALLTRPPVALAATRSLRSGAGRNRRLPKSFTRHGPVRLAYRPPPMRTGLYLLFRDAWGGLTVKPHRSMSIATLLSTSSRHCLLVPPVVQHHHRDLDHVLPATHPDVDLPWITRRPVVSASLGSGTYSTATSVESTPFGDSGWTGSITRISDESDSTEITRQGTALVSFAFRWARPPSTA